MLRGGTALRLDPSPLRALFRGARDPGEFGSAPPREYDPVFAFLEVNLGRVVAARASPLRDDEAVELFSAMRRRPDGRYQSPLYVYFRAGAASTNYHDEVLAGLLARHTGA